MIRLSFHRAHPIEQRGDLIFSGNLEDLRRVLVEIQTAKKYGYAQLINDQDISREIIRIDQEKMR